MVRLLRRNGDDPRVIADLERLVAATAPGADDAGAHAPVAPIDDELPDGFVRWFVRAAVHLRRYLPFYAAAVAWLGVIALADPVDRRGGGDRLAAPGSSRAGSVPPVTMPSGTTTPPTPETAAAAADVADAYAETLAAAGRPAPASPGTTARPSGPGQGGPAAGDGGARPPRRPLAIVRAGYSSRTGGTPLEQAPPGGGLPVAAAGGQATKRSFVGLVGEESILRLALVNDPSNVGAEQAVVRACAIGAAGWKAERGTAFEDEPAWGEPCVTAVRGADGVFTFDLSVFGEVERRPGFALTPGDATFHLTFEPAAAPAG